MEALGFDHLGSSADEVDVTPPERRPRRSPFLYAQDEKGYGP
jgi:hypothetical protein